MDGTLWFLVIVVVVNSFVEVVSSQNPRSGCPNLKLLNGRIRYRQRGRFAKFQCNNGYLLAGDKYSSCFKGKWDNPKPACVRPTCKKVSPPANGFIYPEHRGALLRFYCLPNFVLRGAESTFCDGTKWSANIPTCVGVNEEPKYSCDFESDDLCGWTHDLNHDFDWRRQNFKTPSGHVGTGPSFDHTKGRNQDGYYVYIESSSRIQNDTARLLSPVYKKMDTGFCFQFYYHMYGETIGQLKVYIKTVDDNLDKLKPAFQKSGNQRDQWHMGYVSMDVIDQPFQVVVEGVRGLSYTSDIAIDDVNLLENSCQENEIDITTSTEVLETEMSITVYDSCENRCNTDQNDTYNCECSDSCYELNTCCPDFNIFCILDASDFDTEGTTYSTEDTTTPTEPKTSPITKMADTTKIPTTVTVLPTTITQTTNIPKTTKTIQIPTKKTTIIPLTKKPTTTIVPTKKTTTPPKITQKVIKTTPKVTQNPKVTRLVKLTTVKLTTTTRNKMVVNTTPVTKKSVTKVIPNKQNEVLKPKLTTIFIEDFTTKILPVETDYFTKTNNFEYEHHSLMVEEKSINKKILIFAGTGSFLFVLVLVVAIFYFLRRHRVFGGFRGYGSTRSESMSDVRFLASDEILDFTLRTPDD